MNTMKTCMFISDWNNNYPAIFMKQFEKKGITVVPCETFSKLHENMGKSRAYDFAIIFDPIPETSSHMIYAKVDSVANLLNINGIPYYIFRKVDENADLFSLAEEHERFLSIEQRRKAV